MAWKYIVFKRELFVVFYETYQQAQTNSENVKEVFVGQLSFFGNFGNYVLVSWSGQFAELGDLKWRNDNEN